MFPEFFKQLVSDYFKVYSITDEDRKKTEQYKANAARVHAQASFADFDKFRKDYEENIKSQVSKTFGSNVFCVTSLIEKVQ